MMNSLVGSTDSDAGMHIGEAAGLTRDDIVLDADIPHVIIRPHPWSV